MESLEQSENSHSKEVFKLRDELQRNVINHMRADGEEKSASVFEWIELFSQDFSDFFNEKMHEDPDFVEKLKTDSMKDIVKEFALVLVLRGAHTTTELKKAA